MVISNRDLLFYFDLFLLLPNFEVLQVLDLPPVASELSIDVSQLLVKTILPSHHLKQDGSVVGIFVLFVPHFPDLLNHLLPLLLQVVLRLD